MRSSLTIWLAMLAILAGACGGDTSIYVTRKVKIVGRVATADSRPGVDCRVSHSVFGEERLESATPVPSGQAFSQWAMFATPLRTPQPFRPRIAVIVRCTGYKEATSPEREAAVAWMGTATTDFGTITASHRQE
jgi:hypothetical protein